MIGGNISRISVALAYESMLVGKEVLSFSPICGVVCIRYEYVIKDEIRPFLFHFDRNYFDANMFYVYKIVVWLGSEDYILYEFLIFVFVKFIYSDKATKFCKISTLDLTGTT